MISTDSAAVNPKTAWWSTGIPMVVTIPDEHFGPIWPLPGAHIIPFKSINYGTLIQ